MKKKSKFQKHYRDIMDAGGLAVSLQRSFKQIGSSLEVTVKQVPVTNARIEQGNRFSQIYLGSDERLFLFDFWKDGVCMGNGKTGSLVECVKAIDVWVGNDGDLDAMETLDYVELGKEARVHEEGRVVEHRWGQYVESIGERFPSLVEFVIEASKDPQLSVLFPFTSLNRFCFSRCTGYPFTRDIPHVSASKDAGYVVVSPENEELGRGDARQAVELVVRNLPPNCGPAVQGTSKSIGDD